MKQKKHISYDVKNLNNYCNVIKTEVTLFRPLKNKINCYLHFEQLCPKDSVKHLGIKLDKSLTWNHKINNVPAKMNRDNDMLSKIRHLIGF